MKFTAAYKRQSAAYFRKKAARRRALAKVPFGKKLRMLLRMQERRLAILTATGRKDPILDRPWPLSEAGLGGPLCQKPPPCQPGVRRNRVRKSR